MCRIIAAAISLFFGLAAHGQQKDVKASSTEKISIIGDSHSTGQTGPFGACLENALKKKDRVVERYAVGGADAFAWVRPKFCYVEGKPIKDCKPFIGSHAQPDVEEVSRVPDDYPNLDRILDTHPTIAVVELGTNDLTNNCQKHVSGDARYRYIGQIIEKIKTAGSQCVWVGPPKFGANAITKYCIRKDDKTDKGGDLRYNREVDQFRDFVLSKNCQYIDSREIKRKNGQPITPPNRDPHIYDHDVACEWAAGVARKIDSAAKPAASTDGVAR